MRSSIARLTSGMPRSASASVVTGAVDRELAYCSLLVPGARCNQICLEARRIPSRATFVLGIDEALRIRTGERGTEAV
jgi:hypothetical protein